MGKTTERGKRGEERAADFLRSRGYQIVERNYRWRGGEIDLIAREGGCLVFVEVKSRATHAFGVPEDHITREKRSKLIRTATRYVAEHPSAAALDVRFDVVALSSGEARLHRNAFALES